MECVKWIEIDLDNLIFNVTQLKKKLSSKVKIMAVVKSDAYGHGLIEVAKVLYPEVDSFAVIDLEEALRLIDIKIKKPILILGPIENFQIALDNQFRITAYDIETIKNLFKIAEKKGKKGIIHVKIDTGMSRVGIYYTQALDFLKDIQNNYSKNIDIEGIYSHLSMADVEDDSFTQIQYNRFIDLINSLQKILV
jgi:alanine racemase